MKSDEFLPVSRIAQEIRRSERWTRRLLDAGAIRGQRDAVGRRLARRSDVIEFLEKSKQRTAASVQR